MFHKIASSAVAKQILPEIQTATHCTQHGIGLENGSAIFVDKVRMLMRHNPEHAIAQIDISNAFGRVLKRNSSGAARVLQHWITSTQWAMCQRATREYVFLATQEGIPQGDPASAALFVAIIQLAIDEVLEQEQHQDQDGVQPETGAQILAYVDDLTVLAPPVRLPHVLERLEAALASVGLQVNLQKTQVHLHRSTPMPATEVWNTLWSGKGSHDGITLVGQPFDPESREWDFSVPYGTASYTRKWLATWQLRQAQTVNRILALLDQASPGMNVMHHLWYLLQLSWNAADVHLWRSVPYDQLYPHLVHPRDTILHAMETIFPELFQTELSRHVIFLDARMGDLGIALPPVRAAVLQVSIDLQRRRSNDQPDEPWGPASAQAWDVLETVDSPPEQILHVTKEDLMARGHTCPNPSLQLAVSAFQKHRLQQVLTGQGLAELF